MGLSTATLPGSAAAFQQILSDVQMEGIRTDTEEDASQSQGDSAEYRNQDCLFRKYLMKRTHRHSLVYVAGILLTLLVTNHDALARTIQVRRASQQRFMISRP